LTNVHVHEADGGTQVRSKWLFIDRRSGGVVSGDYNDVVVRTAEGWRISHRSLVIRHPEKYTPSSPGPEARATGE